MVFAQSPSKKKTRPSKGRDSLGDSRGATLIARIKDLSLSKGYNGANRPTLHRNHPSDRLLGGEFAVPSMPRFHHPRLSTPNGRATIPLQSIVMLLNVITRADIIMYLDTVSICIETMMKVF